MHLRREHKDSEITLNPSDCAQRLIVISAPSARRAKKRDTKEQRSHLTQLRLLLIPGPKPRDQKRPRREWPNATRPLPVPQLGDQERPKKRPNVTQPLLDADSAELATRGG